MTDPSLPDLPTEVEGQNEKQLQKFPKGVTVDDAKRITELANEDRRPLIHCPYTSKLRP